MMDTKKIDGQLEIDIERGVLYFHSKVSGCSILRICGLKIPKIFGKREIDAIDITLKDLDAHPVMYSVKGVDN